MGYLALSLEKISKILYKIYDLRARHALQISPLFISYSHADRTFIHKLESHLLLQHAQSMHADDIPLTSDRNF